MHRPCIIGQVAPIIPEDSELHEEHWQDHPEMKGIVFFHVGCKPGDLPEITFKLDI
jgi:hypothetical protein